MRALSLTDLQRRVEGLNELPTLPAILFPVLDQLSGNSDDIDLQKTVQLVAHDGALSTQVLHMANSPLFGMRQRISTLRCPHPRSSPTAGYRNLLLPHAGVALGRW